MEFSINQPVLITQAHNQFKPGKDVYTVGCTNLVCGQYTCLLMKDGECKGAIPQSKLKAK